MRPINQIASSYLMLIMCVFMNPVSATEQSAHKLSVEIKKAWSPKAPPVAPARAGYFLVTNTSDEEITIVAVDSPMFSKVSIHETTRVDGHARMTGVERLLLKPMETLELKSGDKHLMLMGKTALFRADATSIPVILKLDTGESIQVELVVKDTHSSMAEVNHGEHKHH